MTNESTRRESSALLRSLGFNVATLSAGVANAEGDFSSEFDHMTLMVTLAERWLVDVGFGDSFTEPLRIDERGAQAQGDRPYRIDAAGDYLVMMQRASEHEDWKAQYRFKLNTYEYSDFAERCRFHQTSPESHFTRNRICSRLMPMGRISLSDAQFIVSENGVRRERPVTSRENYAELLKEHFDIVI